MTSSLHTELHHDHIVWKAEAAQWRDDMTIWQNELSLAEEHLRSVQEALAKHRDALTAHALLILQRAQAANRHELALAAYESGETGADLPAMAVEHQQESLHQQQQRAAHDRIRRHHLSMIAACSLLQKAVQNPM